MKNHFYKTDKGYDYGATNNNAPTSIKIGKLHDLIDKSSIIPTTEAILNKKIQDNLTKIKHENRPALFSEILSKASSDYFKEPKPKSSETDSFYKATEYLINDLDFNPNIVIEKDGSERNSYVLLDKNGLQDYRIYFISLLGMLPIEKISSTSDSMQPPNKHLCNYNINGLQYNPFDDLITKQESEIFKSQFEIPPCIFDKYTSEHTLKKIFQSLDMNDDGIVEMDNIERILSFSHQFYTKNYEIENSKKIIKAFDKSGVGEFKFPEFKAVIKSIA